MTAYNTFALEAAELLALSKKASMENPVYVLLTDTGTGFSKVSKAVTGDPYNHVSLALDSDLEYVYTYALKTDTNGSKGGLKRESKEMLKGARYSLYEMSLTKDMYVRLVDRLDHLEKNVSETGYNHWGLVNTLLGKEVFKSAAEVMICSQFLASVMADVGVEFFKGRAHSTIKPYEFVKSKLLKHVRRGKF